jgi:hypothetical protein
MVRKPTLASDLDLDALKAAPGSATAQQFIHEQPSTRAAVTSSPPVSGEGLLKARAVATTLYLLPNDHKRLRHLCSERGVAAQTLLLDAIDLLFAEAGERPVERWETRRKVR